MSYQVALINFEGPLDLLLQLIERSELKITEISLSEVTEQYLLYIERLRDLDPDELNRFVELAAKLILIKSQALIPDLQTPETEADISELSAQLAGYQRYKRAAERLAQLLSEGRQSFTPVATPDAFVETPTPKIEIASLRAIMQSVLSNLPPDEPAQKIDAVVSLEAMTERIMASLGERSSLRQILEGCQTRIEVVICFLAILELSKTHRLTLEQDEQFGDIIICNGA